MDRRTLLAAAGAGLAGLSGCGSSGSPTEPTPTPTPATDTPTATRTPTETPEPTVTPPDRRYQPQMLDVAIVSQWSAPGDLEANRVDAVRRGQPIIVAFRYRLRVPSGTINLKEGVEIVHDDELVVRRNRERDRTVDSAGLYTWEDGVTLSTDDWPLGELTASVSIGELQLHRVSDPMSVSFELTSG